MPHIKLDLGRCIDGKPQPEGYFNVMAHKRAYSSKVPNEVWNKKMEELWDFLKHRILPEGVGCGIPKLSTQAAMNIVWFLQEVTKVLPDNYDVCDICGDLKKSDYLHYYETNGKNYCESCIGFAPVTECENCGHEAGYKTQVYSNKHGMYLCGECKKEKRNKVKENKTGGIYDERKPAF